MNKIQRLLRSTRAATAVEYGLILALIFIVALSAMSAVGTSTITMWNKVSSNTTSVL
jgi:pilus assembly protein Flp/PilA|nr:Flp family type IVb pilin [Sphingopyxis sp. DBS4]